LAEKGLKIFVYICRKAVIVTFSGKEKVLSIGEERRLGKCRLQEIGIFWGKEGAVYSFPENFRGAKKGGDVWDGVVCGVYTGGFLAPYQEWVGVG